MLVMMVMMVHVVGIISSPTLHVCSTLTILQVAPGCSAQ